MSQPKANIITLAENQDELRLMQDIRRTFEAIPAHLREKACRELLKPFPNIEIKMNGKPQKQPTNC